MEVAKICSIPKRSSRRLERQHRAHRRAIRVGYDVAARLAPPGLLFYQLKVLCIHFRNDQGNVGGHAEGAGIGDHGATGGGERGLLFAGKFRVDRGEDDPGRAGRIGRRTVILAMRSGRGVSSRHLAASPYVLPLDRSLAASQATSNHGWSSRSWMKRWPTIPVAPRIPIGCFFCMALNTLVYRRIDPDRYEFRACRRD